MSVVAPPDSSIDPEGATGLRARLGIDAWGLCREFVERAVSEAQATATRDHPGHPVAEVDWESIWGAGRGASSDELAIGRILRAASEVSRRIARGASVSAPASTRAVSSEPEARPDNLTINPPPTEDVQDAPTGAATVILKPVVAPADPVTAPVEPATPNVEPVEVPEDPLAELGMLATAAVDSVTTDRPHPRTTTLVEPANREQLLIAPVVLDEPDAHAAAKGRTTRIHSEWATFFTWIRNLGAIMLLFVAWQLWGTSISQHQAQDQLKTAFDASLRAHHVPKATASGPALVPAVTHVPAPPDGTVVAELQIPAIGVNQYVVAGTNATDLSKGPGHYVGTAMPGQAGNVAIAGHRTTHGAPFNRLGELKHGDRIILTSSSGQHLTYVVSGTPQAVSPSDVAVLNYYGDNRITLTTCTPEFSASQRLIAVGMLQQPVATPAALSAHVTYHVVNPATASWDWSLLPAVGIETCLLLLLGLSYRRFDFWFGRSSKWLILVPLWGAGLYLLFASLTTFLPETF